MSNVDFKNEFANILTNSYLPTNATPEEYATTWSKINNIIFPNIPQKLFRFRTCNADNIISFQRQTISTCVAKAFKDRYDSLVYIDRTNIDNVFQQFVDAGGVEAIYSSFEDGTTTEVLGNILSPDAITRMNEEMGNMPQQDRLSFLYKNLSDFRVQLSYRISNYIENMRADRLTKIACFTEDIRSLYMWDQYADGYKGYALEYDFRDYHSRGCLTCPDIQSCKKENKNISKLFPVIYTTERYNATGSVLNIMLSEILEQIGNKDIQLPIDQLHWYKAYLYKDVNAYSHEKEWRIITRCPNQLDSDFTEIPNATCLKAVYYGPFMEKRYKEFLMNIAHGMGIKQYEVTLDEHSTKYELKVQEIEISFQPNE